MASMDFKDKLANLCKLRGWDQADLARAIQRETGEAIARTTVNAWFNGKGQPNLKSGLKVARTLGVSLDYLADDSLESPPVPASSKLPQKIVEVIDSIGPDEAWNRLVLTRRHIADKLDVLEAFSTLYEYEKDDVLQGLIEQRRSEQKAYEKYQSENPPFDFLEESLPTGSPSPAIRPQPTHKPSLITRVSDPTKPGLKGDVHPRSAEDIEREKKEKSGGGDGSSIRKSRRSGSA